MKLIKVHEDYLLEIFVFCLEQENTPLTVRDHKHVSRTASMKNLLVTQEKDDLKSDFQHLEKLLRQR